MSTDTSTDTSTGTSIDTSTGTTTSPDTGTGAGADAAARQDEDQVRDAEQPLGVVGADGGAAGGSPGALGRLRAGAGRRPVLTGALVALLAAGAAFGGGFAVGRVTAPAAATLVPGDGLERMAPGDGMVPPDGLSRDGFGPGGQGDGTTDGSGGGTDDGSGGSAGEGSGGVQDGSST